MFLSAFLSLAVKQFIFILEAMMGMFQMQGVFKELICVRGIRSIVNVSVANKDFSASVSWLLKETILLQHTAGNAQRGEGPWGNAAFPAAAFPAAGTEDGQEGHVQTPPTAQSYFSPRICSSSRVTDGRI